MKFLLFFLALSACSTSIDVFDIPHTFERCAANDATWHPSRMPEGLNRLHMVFKEDEDVTILRNEHYSVRFQVRKTEIRSGDGIFVINVARNGEENRHQGYAFYSPPSYEVGGIALIHPQKAPIVYKFSLRPSRTPSYPCIYSVDHDRLTINRFLCEYGNGTQIFVEVTFEYKNLTDVKVSYGKKRQRDDGSVWTDGGETVDFGFGECIHGASAASIA